MKFSEIIKNNLLRIATYNSLSMVVKLVSGFILSKTIAYLLLPQGMAITGNLRSFLGACQGVSSEGIKSGVIKYVSEYNNDEENLKKIISTSFFGGLFLTSIISITLFNFASYWSMLVFNSDEYMFAIRILAIVFPLFSINIFILSVINGLGKYKKIITINTIGYAVTTFIIVILVWKFQLDGAIIAMILAPSLLLIITLFWVKDIKFIFNNISYSSFSIDYLKGISSLLIMAVFSGITIPITHVLLKNHIIDNIGLNEAGYWEAMIKISQYYLLFVMSLFTLYLLPKLSRNKTHEGFKTIVFQFYKSILPLLLLGFLIIYALRYWVVRVTLTPEFLPIQDLFFWQLSGDFFKVMSFTIAYQMQAKRMIYSYIFVELLFVLVTYYGSIYLIDIFDVKGAVIGYTVSYIFYFLLMLFIFRKSLLIYKRS